MSPVAVDLTVVPTDGLSSPDIATLDARLSDEERARRERYLKDDDRVAFTIARALVRTGLSRHGEHAPHDWTFETNAHGCPFVVAAQAGTPPVFFNISHTRGLVAIAIVRGHAVGVDVEDARRVVREDVAGRFFAPAEVADLRALPADAQPRVFFDYWTLKEAYIKARGLGLAIPLGDFAFVLRPPAPPVVRFVDGFDDDPRRWRFWQAWPTTHHRLGLAVACGEAGLDVHLRTVAAATLAP